mgnify:FL=1
MWPRNHGDREEGGHHQCPMSPVGSLSLGNDNPSRRNTVLPLRHTQGWGTRAGLSPATPRADPSHPGMDTRSHQCFPLQLGANTANPEHCPPVWSQSISAGAMETEGTRGDHELLHTPHMLLLPIRPALAPQPKFRDQQAEMHCQSGGSLETAHPAIPWAPGQSHALLQTVFLWDACYL